jgi:serine/threonine-protein kinase
MKLTPETLVNDRYRIIEQIGCGGMAVVYRAKDEKLDRDVTFKVLREEHLDDNEFIKRFNVEARAAASLSHQNIVSVYDVGNDGDIYFIVMEYIEGCTLKELINRKAPFGNKEVISISLQVASALEHAHKNNIVHRDIKPQNILVSSSGKNPGCVKVTDFGIARAASSTTTSTEAMGSVQYFSPEQAQGGFVDAKSDIYSLGIMMFEMITGILPFDGDSAVTLAMKHIKEPIPDIAKLNPNASKSLIKIITKATQKRPYARYQTAAQLIADLKAALSDDSGSFLDDGENVDSSEGDTIKMSDSDLEKIRNGSQKSEKKNVPIIDEIEDIDVDIDNKYNPADKTYDKNKERKVVIAAVITSIVVIAAMTVAGVFIIDSINNPKVKVPYFVGLTSEEAEELAQQSEISLIEESEHSETVAEGVIISQSVPQNTKMLKADRLTLVISLGSEMVEVPDVKNLSEEDAKLSLEQRGLGLGEVKREASDSVIVGAVIKASVSEGTKVSPGTVIDIYVSTGPEVGFVIVPDVLDVDKDKAVEMLEQEKLEAKIIEDYSDKYDEGKISGQGVKAGSSVPKGYIVTLTVSKGPDPNAVKETTTQPTTAQVTTVAAAKPKRAVSIPVMPEFDKLTLPTEEESPDPQIEVKVVAKTASDTRTVIDNTYNKSDFPFAVNDQISENTSYDIYYNNVLIKSVDESY